MSSHLKQYNLFKIYFQKIKTNLKYISLRAYKTQNFIHTQHEYKAACF